MSFTFTYEVGGKPSYYRGSDGEYYDDGLVGTEEFEYKIDYNEAEDYIIRTHEVDDIIEDWIKAFADTYTTKEIKALWDNFDGEFDGTMDSVKAMTEDQKLELVSGIDNMLYQLIDETGYYDDELKDYFEQDAYDEWEETL